MHYRLNFKSYCRSLSIPLRTANGVWTERRGVLVRIEAVDTGCVGFGEVAPLSDFGTESMRTAVDFFSQLGEDIDDATIESIPSELLCCRYALESARDALRKHKSSPRLKALDVAALLPAGKAALDCLDMFMAAGYRVFKWKIGVEPLAVEMDVFKCLVARLPQAVCLRLDANGSLTESSAREWMASLLKFGAGKIEFLEQPLPRGEEERMFALAEDFPISLALDESVTGFEDLKCLVNKGWRGVLVVKPSLLGKLEAFRQWRKQCPCPLVYSSAFETAVGVESGLGLAATDPVYHRALGFGTLIYFKNDGLGLHLPGCRLLSGVWDLEDFEALWKRV